MALLEILHYPDPRLRIKAKPVTQIDDEIRKIVEDMYETMYASHGVGLAATQVGIDKQIFVMDVSETRDQRYCVMNPEILSREGTQLDMEGCLSVEGTFDKVERAAKVRLRGMDLAGKTFELDAQELMAACIQHEIDHLNGILFIDHLSRLKQDRIRKKIEKTKRRAE
ncbi:peptide deformylase [Aquicella lusitana]|uniref:Peptide deformylase n=1 Tax=Aquicella lusitana TaxID=254246 RepID=A0A370G778_9COXI|nr:peptide deformylase [Aquicella lusitana]RDI38374.1 peptide deformylase [Aquicella lusitana]VVC72387.1 Peptide deformylase [Aquicella lusitana]